jgi:hypothetical protein
MTDLALSDTATATSLNFEGVGECNFSDLPVEPRKRPSETWSGVAAGERGIALRPEIESAVSACVACGQALCGQLDAGREAITSSYIPFIARVVPLEHSLTEDEREGFLHSRKVRSSPSERMTSRYLPIIQALISDAEDVRRKHRPKCTQWAQLARGLVEGCNVDPTEAAIEAFLKKKDGRRTGRSMAKAGYENLLDVRERKAVKAAEKAAKEAARCREQESGPEHVRTPEQALKVLAASTEDERSWPTDRELAGGALPVLQEVLRRWGVEVVMPDGGRVTVRRLEIVVDGGPRIVVEPASDRPA